MKNKTKHTYGQCIFTHVLIIKIFENFENYECVYGLKQRFQSCFHCFRATVGLLKNCFCLMISIVKMPTRDQGSIFLRTDLIHFGGANLVIFIFIDVILLCWVCAHLV